MWTLCAVDSKVSQTKSDPLSCITVTRVRIRVLDLQI